MKTQNNSPQSTVGFLPWWPGNPYQVLLKKELNRAGVRVIGDPPMSLLRILVGRDGLDVVHVHWPHGTYKTTMQAAYVLTVLLAYRLLRNNIVWTVHELTAYESCHPRRDAWFRTMVMKLSRRLFVHGEHTKKILIEQHRYRRPIDVVRHPSYVGWYKDEVTREQSREKLQVPEGARVYLYFGYIKPYKGVEDLIRAFGGLRDQNALLFIVGRPLNATIEQEVQALAALDPRVRTHLTYVADDDIQCFFRAADVVVFPFRETQTSGSLMLALSYGRPVIVPDIATLSEYVDGDMGFFFDPASPGSLERALQLAHSTALSDMGLRARAKAEALRWSDMAATHVAAYEAIA